MPRLLSSEDDAAIMNNPSGTCRRQEVDVRTFVWWFNIGALSTLSVLMVQGGVHDLLYGTRSGGTAAYLTFAITILGGGLLAGCLALIMNRLR